MKPRKINMALATLACLFPSLVAAGVSVSAEAGYRQDALDWNIADTDGDPNVLSELTWSNLEIMQLKLDLEFSYQQLRLLGSAAYGKINDGDNQDSDYAANNRQAEFSRSNNRAGGDVSDASLGIGYMIEIGNDPDSQRHIMPMAGYSIHRQALTMTDGVQTIPASGAFAGLNSTYDTEWSGPWVGISFRETDPRRGFIIGLDLVYHEGDYSAEADWNLRADFAHPKSFEHWADASGVTVSLHSHYAVSEHWLFVASLDYQRWYTDAGIDRVFPAGGGILHTRLNRVNWESMAVNLGLEWRPDTR